MSRSVGGAEDEVTAHAAATHLSAVDVSFADAILNMVNNIAVNVLGGGEPEAQGASCAEKLFQHPLFHPPVISTPFYTFVSQETFHLSERTRLSCRLNLKPLARQLLHTSHQCE